VIERRFRAASAPRTERAAELAVVARGLADRVRPLALARDRVLPVHAALSEVFPDGGLRRGSVVACQGQAAGSVALALATGPSQAGSWVGLVGLGTTWGLGAAAEWGIALDRVLNIPVVSAAQLPTVLAAVVDGVDVVVTAGAGVRAGEARRLAARLTQRGGVLLVLGDPGGFAPDLVCTAGSAIWEGLAAGSGRLVARQVRLEVSGRRSDRARRADLWFPGPTGTPCRVQVDTAGADIAGVDAAGDLHQQPLRVASVG